MNSSKNSTPYSLRLPIRLSQLIEQFAKKTGKPAPDTVRAGIEAAFSNEYRMLALDAANGDCANTLRLLRGAAAEPDCKPQLSLSVYSALMYFLHWAYLHSGASGNATPRYVAAMLDVIRDLIDLGEEMSFTDGHQYARHCLGIKEDENLHAGVQRIKSEITNRLELGFAEKLTRPLEAMADDLQYLDSERVARAFAPHLKTLLPVAVLGAKRGVAKDVVLRDMEGSLPETESFVINSMNWTLCNNTIALVVSEGHHTFAFETHVVLSLFMAIESGALDEVLANCSPISSFRRGEFVMSILDGQVEMHTNGGYRLAISLADALCLVENLKRTFSKPAWQFLVTRYRELSGDI